MLQTEGIEWDIQVPSSSADGLPSAGVAARVFVYMHHREDQLGLYGFATPEERSLFLDLLKVAGIGPRQAIRILSGMNVQDFVDSLDGDDVDRLSSIPGLGKKTAQKIILTLKGSLSLQKDRSDGLYADIINALVQMGFDRQSVDGAVRQQVKNLMSENIAAEDREKELMRRAIIALSSNVKDGAGSNG